MKILEFLKRRKGWINILEERKEIMREKGGQLSLFLRINNMFFKENIIDPIIISYIVLHKSS
jgi:hypothetical protein